MKVRTRRSGEADSTSPHSVLVCVLQKPGTQITELYVAYHINSLETTDSIFMIPFIHAESNFF